VNDIRVKNVYDELRRNTSESIRGDREMSTCEMLNVVRDARREQLEARQDRTELILRDLRTLLALPALPPQPPAEPDSTRHGYCDWLRSVQSLMLPGTVEAQSPAQVQAPERVQTPKLPQRSTRPKLRLSNWSEVATAADRVREADRRADRYQVEVHKKWAISMACITFVIIGIVLALRFPRGGIGLVIGGGLLIFSIHYIGLTAGESLADRGHVEPWIAMWGPNIVLTILGVLGLFWVSRESGSTRGGDFREMAEGLAHLARRLRMAALRRLGVAT
jgi:hypothetical protein